MSNVELFIDHQQELAGGIYSDGNEAHLMGECEEVLSECWDDFIVAQGRLDAMYDILEAA